MAQEDQRPAGFFLPRVCFHLGLQRDLGLQGPPCPGVDVASGMDQALPGIHGGILGLLQVHHAADQHLAFQHGIPLLEGGLSLQHLHMCDDAGGGRDHMGRGGLIPELRRGQLFSYQHLRPCTVEVYRHPSQVLQADQRLLADPPHIQAGTVGPHPHPLPGEFRQDGGGGYFLVSGYLDGEDKPGEDAHRCNRERQTQQKGVPPAKPGQEEGNPGPALGRRLAHDLFRQLAHPFGIPPGHPQPQTVLVQPLQIPKSYSALGAKVQKPLGKSACHRKKNAAPQKIDDGLHTLPSVFRYARSTPTISPVISSSTAFIARSSRWAPRTFTISFPPLIWISSVP